MGLLDVCEDCCVAFLHCLLRAIQVAHHLRHTPLDGVTIAETSLVQIFGVAVYCEAKKVRRLHFWDGINSLFTRSIYLGTGCVNCLRTGCVSCLQEFLRSPIFLVKCLHRPIHILPYCLYILDLLLDILFFDLFGHLCELLVSYSIAPLQHPACLIPDPFLHSLLCPICGHLRTLLCGGRPRARWACGKNRCCKRGTHFRYIPPKINLLCLSI
mmetsp:Transcript_7319/g.14033  ORF Transcript_7319/g.14033 Transcript_7319/m.14033 type:complete len:213 (-) Transcript_7319:3195-3833(-)